MAETDNGVKLVAGELDRLLKAPSAAGSKKP
jgi:hypothetical protein